MGKQLRSQPCPADSGEHYPVCSESRSGPPPNSSGGLHPLLRHSPIRMPLTKAPRSSHMEVVSSCSWLLSAFSITASWEQNALQPWNCRRTNNKHLRGPSWEYGQRLTTELELMYQEAATCRAIMAAQ